MRRLWFSMLLCSVSSFAQAGFESAMGHRDHMPTVQVAVNGKGPYTFAIDTAAQGLGRIDAALVEALSLPRSGEVLAGDGSSAAHRSFDLVRVQQIQLGDLVRRDLELMTRDYNAGRSSRIDGILGLEFFAGQTLTLDYIDQKVRISDDPVAADDPHAAALLPGHPVPTIEIIVADHTLITHIDSGNAGALVLPGKLVSDLKLKDTPIVVGRARTVANEFEIKSAMLDGAVRFAGHELRQPILSFADPFDKSNLGAQILSGYAVHFDTRNQRVRFEAKAPRTPENVPPAFVDLLGRYGMRTISYADGRLYLQRVGGPKLALKQLEDGEFGLEQVPEARLRFERDPKQAVVALEVLVNGRWERSPRDDRA